MHWGLLYQHYHLTGIKISTVSPSLCILYLNIILCTSIFFIIFHIISFLTAETAGGVFFEGDMILPRKMVKLAVDEGSMVQSEEKRKGTGDGEPETETITAPLFMRWPNGIVPYVIHKDLSKCESKIILNVVLASC